MKINVTKKIIWTSIVVFYAKYILAVKHIKDKVLRPYFRRTVLSTSPPFLKDI